MYSLCKKRWAVGCCDVDFSEAALLDAWVRLLITCHMKRSDVHGDPGVLYFSETMVTMDL